MSAHHSSLRKSIVRFFSLFCAIANSAGCQGGVGLPSAQVSPTAPSTATAASQLAEVTFEALLPVKLPEGQNLYLEILDEVTGLALNPSRARMEISRPADFYCKGSQCSGFSGQVSLCSR